MIYGTMISMADQVMLRKYILKNLARGHNQDGDLHAEVQVPKKD